MIFLILVLLIIVGIILLLGHFVGHWFDKKDNFHKNPSLGFVALFKNEEDIIEEWIMHHKREGVTEFILIDNDSTDNSPTLARKYPEVTIIKDSRCPFNCTDNISHQTQMVTDACKKAKSDWLIVGDLDEFWYIPKGKITDYLKTVPKKINQITTEWLLFGSNGYINQPPSVVKYFTKRQKKPSKASKWKGHEKSIIRRKAIGSQKIHHHYGITRKNVIYFKAMDNNPLILNHYRAQSKKKWYSRRNGRVGSPGGGSNDNEDWWKAIDRNEVIDTELAHKKYKV